MHIKLGNIVHEIQYLLTLFYRLKSYELHFHVFLNFSFTRRDNLTLSVYLSLVYICTSQRLQTKVQFTNNVNSGTGYLLL